MWTSERNRRLSAGEPAADVGVVTLNGDPAGVELGGERRWLSVYSPGGYRWRPAAGDQVLVRDRFSGNIQTVDNEAFLAVGGSARRVVTMPGRSNYKTMRYTGRFQLDKSASELERLEITVAQPFCAWPGDLVRVQRSNWERNGLYRAVQTTVGMDGNGYWTRMELAALFVV